MPKVRAVGNTLDETYDSVADYVKANPGFVNTDTDAPPTDEEVKMKPVMTTHTTAGEGHTLTVAREGARRKTRRGKKARRARRKSRR